MTELQAGDPAPSFEALDETGRPWALQDLSGQHVVLYFYPRDDTPGCTKEACSFRDNMGAIKDAGAVVLGISADPADSHQDFREKHDLNFPLLVDEDAEISKRYGVWVEKQMFGNEFMGIQRATFLIGPDGTLAHVWPKVKPEDHAEEVLEVLEEVA